MFKKIIIAVILIGIILFGIDKIYYKLNKENGLDGKVVALLGDSLIEGYLVEEGGLDYFLKEKSEKTIFINNSKSGSTVTDNSGDDNIIFINQVKSLEKNPDIILFNGGINDVIGYTKGFLSQKKKKEIGKISLDEIIQEDSVMNDFEEAIIEMKNRYPNAKLAYINLCLLNEVVLNNYLNSDSNRAELEQRKEEFFEQIKVLCKKYNIAYMDISNKFEGKEKEYHQDDYMHIKSEGYRYIADDILDYLKSL